MKFTLSWASAILLAAAPGRSEWVWQNPVPAGCTINVIRTGGPEEAWFSCASGIWHTRDGGRTWFQQLNALVQDLVFVEGGWGWSGAFDGSVFVTRDGGARWVKTAAGARKSAVSLHFADSLRGWVVGNGAEQTDDGGRTWRRMPIAGSGFNAVAFGASGLGWAATDGRLMYRTSDFGATWKSVGLDTIWGFRGFQPMGGDTVLAMDIFGRLYRSEDAGESWKPLRDLYGAGRDFHFSDARKGWIVVTSITPGVAWGAAHATRDGGESWEERVRVSNGLEALALPDPGRIWIGGERGELQRSSDSGRTWTNLRRGFSRNLYAVRFADSLFGLAVGDSGMILRTEDGGRKWERMESGVGVALLSVAVVDPLHAWACGGPGGVVLRTTDGGATWERQTAGTLTNHVFTSVFFADTLNGWLVGVEGWSGDPMFRTRDGGNTWEDQNSRYLGLTQVQFTDEKHGWIAKRTGSYLRTRDGGATWEAGARIGTSGIVSLSFVDSLHGWMLGRPGYLYRTRDGGTTWDSTMVVEKSPTAIHFQDSTHGWMVGLYGGIWHTRDGGTSWVLQGAFDAKMNDVFFTAGKTGWAVGDGGSIVAARSGGEPAAYDSLPAALADPPRTRRENRLRASLDRNGLILAAPRLLTGGLRLTIFDPSGRLVWSGRVGAGATRGVFRFDLGRRLPPGIYFLKVEGVGLGTRIHALVAQP